MTGAMIALRVSVGTPNNQNEELRSMRSNIQRACANDHCVSEQQAQQHLILDVSLLNSWCTMILDTISQLAGCLSAPIKRQVSLALLVLHCLRSFYVDHETQQLIYRTLSPLLPGSDEYWDHVYYGWSTIATTWVVAVMAQWTLCILLGLRPRDALITCGILGAFLLDCVPFVSVVASLGFYYIRQALPFEQCVALSVTLSCASFGASMILRRWVYSTLSSSKDGSNQ